MEEGEGKKVNVDSIERRLRNITHISLINNLVFFFFKNSGKKDKFK